MPRYSVQLFGVSTPRGLICMPRQHQISRLPAERQGEEGHETATKYPALVRINSVSHTADIHLPDPQITL